MALLYMHIILTFFPSLSFLCPSHLIQLPPQSLNTLTADQAIPTDKDM